MSSTPLLQIALIGFGKMAHAILPLLNEHNMKCEHIFTRTPPEVTSDYPAVHIWHSLESLPIDLVDIVIDISSQEGLLNRVEYILKKQKALVVGTTGWTRELQKVESLVEQLHGTLLYGANFSLGIALFDRLVADAAQLFSHFPNFEVGLFERHHRYKIDHPSGTAKQLSTTLLRNSKNLHASESTLEGKALGEKTLHLAYQRAGLTPGYHEVLFESLDERVIMSHETKSRATFAHGALLASRWLSEKPTGIYHFNNMIEELLHAT
jgi:4-hydroxy-tetrahydrodipicolinate reductase